MAVIVQKYGGSSVADIERLQRVADKVVATRRAGHDVVVTVSAMGKSTDNLLSLAREASAREGQGSSPARRERQSDSPAGNHQCACTMSYASPARVSGTP